MSGPHVRWGVISTAHIAAGNFLPSLRASGNGVAYAVASRSLTAARQFAQRNGVEHAVEGYDTLLHDDAIDAIYVPLPNSMHAEWTIASLRAGKAVLCEKPLCLTVEETQQVLRVARETGQLLWEAFVFPFNRQTARLRQLLSDGAIGDPKEIRSVFHFALQNPDDIRNLPDLGGGGLYDVGCYCVSFANLVFATAPDRAAAMVTLGDTGVDITAEAILNYPGERRLMFSTSIGLPSDLGTTIAGSRGRIELNEPYHPREAATLTVVKEESRSVEHFGSDVPTFTDALRAMNAAILGEEPPRHLAVDDALAVAQGLQLIREAAL